ncbi:hypothetical protein GGI05_000803, partial [Coemansia sp. RSA 2603]
MLTDSSTDSEHGGLTVLDTSAARLTSMPSAIASTGAAATAPLSTIPEDHLTESPPASASDAGISAQMQSAQVTSQSIHTSISSAASNTPNFAPLSIAPMAEDVGGDLARNIQMASLVTPAATASHFAINDQALPPPNSSNAVSTDVNGSLQTHIQSAIQDFTSTQPSTTTIASTTSMSSSEAPVDTVATSSFTPDASALGQGIDVAAVVAAVAAANQINAQTQAQAQAPVQLLGAQEQQTTQNSDGLTMMSISSDQITSGMLESISHTTSAVGPQDLFIGAVPQQLLQTTLTSSQATTVTAPQQLSMVNGHSRSTSVIDGVVSMFPTDSSNTVTPRSGMAVSSAASDMTQPMVAQIKQQLQQHQQHQQAQLQLHLQTQGMHNGISTGASTAASANHSGVPSPLPYGTSSTMHMGHRRQMSSTLPSAAYQPQFLQQQQQKLYVDTPMSVSTVPSTLVPGTPMTFGQLQFPPQQPTAAAAPTFQGLQTHHNHHAHSHLGHSRHLSLDTANLRFMSSDISSLHTQQPLHGAFHEQQTQHAHQTDIAQQSTLQYGSSNPLALAQQLQLHSQIQHLQTQEKFQPQPMMVRTMPVTPQHPSALSFATSLQTAPMSDPMIQQQQQQFQQQHQQLQQPQQHNRQRHSYMHHSSCSVDLGSLSSAFNASQFNQALSGQISSMAVNPAATTLNPGDLSPMNFAPNLGYPLFTNDAAPTQPLKQSSSHATLYGDSGITTEAVSGDDLYDDDEIDDDTDGVVVSSSTNNSGNASGSKSQPKGTSSKSANASGNTTPKTKKPYAPYKRFRNSFIFFANAKREQWKLEHPEVSKIQNRGFIQEMSKVWNNMSAEEKAPYLKMANDDKARYEADVKKYGPLPSNSVTSSAASISSTAGLVTASAPVSATVPTDASASAISTLKSKKKDVNSAEIAARLSEAVPIAPAPAPSSVSAPVSAPVTAAGSFADLSALGVDPAATVNPTSIATASSTGSGNSTTLATSAISIAPAPFVPIAAKPTNVPDTRLAPATTTQQPAQQSVSTTQSSPIAPAAVGSSVLMPMANAFSSDNNNIDNLAVANSAYQAWLQHALGQDFSPQAIEFDPSCFVAPDPVGTDDGIYLNPQSLTSSTEDTSYQIMPVPLDGDTIDVSNSDSASKAPSVSGSVTSNGPMITTLVGTKRKSSIDGLPVTNLPMSVKRFRNSFIYFVDEKRREAQQSSDGSSKGTEINNRDFLKEMSALWRALSDEEKGPYLRMADADKERFTRQMREYELEHPDEFAKMSRHKRRRSSTGASNVGTVNISADIIAATKSLEQQQQHMLVSDVNNAVPTAGLNISLLGGSSLPLSQSTASSLVASCAPLSADASQAQQIIQQQILSLTATPMSTTHNTPHATPLLSPNVSVDKSESLIAATHFPSLPSVPEDMVICSEAFVGNSLYDNTASGATVQLITSGSLGLNEYDSSAILSTLPTLTETVDED